MKKYILYCITILIFLCGCGSGANSLPAGSDSGSVTDSGSENSHANKQPLSENISLKGHKAIAFAYNPVSNSLTLFEKNKNTYTAYSLQPGNTWAEMPEQWTVKKSQFLDNFTYGSSGLLYACRKYYDKKGHLRAQSFVQLTNKGKIKTIPLRKLNQTPKSASGTNAKKIRVKNHEVENYSVQDIRFCGTALAITYADHTVKFYNIAEGQALGCDGITGESGRNSFYDYHYISAVPDSSTRKFLLKDYDIRSGELTHTISLFTEKNTTAPYYMANYRERLYLLSADGIFYGNNTENSLTKKIDFSLLGIDASDKIRYFEAARDDVLYIVYENKEAALSLSRLPIR